jgi:hypothetical protein
LLFVAIPRSQVKANFCWPSGSRMIPPAHATLGSKNDTIVALSMESFLVVVKIYLQFEDSPTKDDVKVNLIWKEEVFVIQDHSCCRNLGFLNGK